MYSFSGSKELLQKVLNDPKYVILRWNPAKKKYDEVRPYKVFRDLIKKTIADCKYPNKSEAELLADVNIKVADELVELLPELVSVHLNAGMKFRLPTQPDSNGVIYRKKVEAGSKISNVRDIKNNTVSGQVKSEWGPHYVVKCSSKRPKDVVTKTRLK
jgi:alpha-L-fucosidase